MSRAHLLAWSAGFFDGEGYITIQRRKTRFGDKTYEGHYLRIGINHVAIEPLLEMQRIFGGKLEKQNPDKVVGNRKQRHRWTMSTQAAGDALKQMMPYFRNKNKAAELALDFLKLIGNKGQRVSEETFELREDLKLKITALNAQD